MNKSISEFDPNNYPLNPGKRLLEASAGTGKTFSLAHLVLRLITERECSIDEMLVISFTKATASEIKSKITTRIIAALKGIEGFKNISKDHTEDKVLYEWYLENNISELDEIEWKNLLLKALALVLGL